MALLLAYPWLPVARDSFGSEPYRNWLSANKFKFDLRANGRQLDIPPEFRTAHFIILSEMHGFGAMQQIDLTLLRLLNEEIGLRAYLAELSPAQAMAFNRYVASGDPAPARLVFDRWTAGSIQWGNKEFWQKLSRIRDYNRGKPEDEKILFIGVDAESDREWARTMLDAEREQDEPGFGTFAGIQALNAELLRTGLATAPSPNRYETIIPNIETVLATRGAGQEKFYGLWGIFHGSKVPINGQKTLADLLDRSSGPLAGQVLAIGTLCIENCFNMMPAAALPTPMNGKDGEGYTSVPMSYDTTYIARIRGLNDLRHAMPRNEEIALFRLAGRNSPYLSGPRLVQGSGYLPLVQPFEYEGSAGEASDFLIAIRNSPPLTPWSGEVYDLSGDSLEPASIE